MLWYHNQWHYHLEKQTHLERYGSETESLMKAYFRTLSEKDRRRYAAVEAHKLGWGGIGYISKLFEIDNDTISRGLADLKESDDPADNRVRKEGGGRKKNLRKRQN
ncbi:MAG: hypothetical protein MN733_10185 [Nitrososphaera sp.]|nr:hypothetical protein [Nitrososphaera sp.]